MNSTDFAARAYTPEAGAANPFNSPVIGQAAQRRDEARSQAITAPGQFDYAVEFTRYELHDGEVFSITTRHHSQTSLDNERAKWGG